MRYKSKCFNTLKSCRFHFLGELQFNISSDIKDGDTITLSMNCKIPCFNSLVYINDPSIYQIVSNPGIYEWNITNLLDNIDIFSLSVFIADNNFACQFCRLNNLFDNILLKINNKKNYLEIIKIYFSKNSACYTDWINTLPYERNMYFVKNEGTGNVETDAFISLNKIDCTLDSGPYIIPSKKTITISPLRFTRYIRLSFKNIDNGSVINPLKVSFIAKN